MEGFTAELQVCLAELLRRPAPEPDGEPLVFYRQWLAERNLGLVPIEGAATFSWSGRWLAIVRTADGGEHAVVMFGSPSGPFLDPAGVFDRGVTIESGWLLAALDPQLPTGASPYGEEAGRGAVVAVLLAPRAEEPLVETDEAEAVAGRGLAGDRYGEGKGTFSGGRGYELTLVEAEVLDELGLPWPEARRNIVTSGVSLNALVGRRFRIGPVECIGRRLAEPCAHLERVSRPGLLRPLVHRGGLRADIVSDGRIRVGDEVAPLE